MQVAAPSPGTKPLIDLVLEQEKYDPGVWHSLHTMGWDYILYIELQWRAIPNWQDHYPNYMRLYRNLRRALHATSEYRQFRESILERDGCCTNAKCGTTSQLQVHHIKSWWSYPGLRLDPANCKTLCKWCHREEESSKKYREGEH